MKNQKNRDNMQPLSSVFLQGVLYVDQIYSVLYFFLEGCIFFYKGFGLYYPDQSIQQDIALLVVFAIVEVFRLQMGSIGNKTESSSHVGWFILILIPATAGYFYFLFLQTYVLLIEFILSLLGLVFFFFEILLSLIALSSFKNFEKQSYT